MTNLHRPFDPSRPFTRAEALAAGITPRQLAGPRFRQLLRSVHISAMSPVRRRHRTIAALLLHPDGARASHTSAARMYGLPVPEDAVEHVSVASAADRRWQPDVKSHVSPAHVEAVLVDGVPVSPPTRMFVELASTLGLVDLVVAGDALVRLAGWSRARLVDELEDTGDYWSGRARFAAKYVRDGVDSPMETRLRMLLVLAGLPEPVIGFEVRDADGSVVVRFDLSYPGVRLVIEYDGRVHLERVETWEADVDRDAYLREDAGWMVLKVIARGIYVEPWVTVERVAKALRSRGMLIGRPSEEYLVHFPGRRRAG